MTRPELIPATPALVEAWYGKPAPYTLRGFVAVQDRRPVAVAGIYWIAGMPVAFSEWRPEVDRKTLARGIRLVVGLLDSMKVPVFAVCNGRSDALLAKLGFRPTGESALGGPLLMRIAP
jgi:hypothetical protein